MFRIDPQHLAWVLENLVDGHVVNQVSVPQDIAAMAKLALSAIMLPHIPRCGLSLVAMVVVVAPPSPPAAMVLAAS